MLKWVYIYLITFLLAIPIICSNLRHTALESWLNRNETKEKQRLAEENAVRTRLSLDILKKYGDRENFRAFTKRKCSLEKPCDLLNGGIAISIITVRRASMMSGQPYESRYLLQTLAKFLELVNATRNQVTNLSVCNVDSQPENYADALFLPKWLPVYKRFNISSSKVQTLRYDALLEKEKQDYVFCLDQLLATNASYLLLVEDDAMPRDNLFPVLEQLFATERHQQYAESTEFRLKDITFIKLYHPERLIGFLNFDLVRVLELLAAASLLTSVSILISGRLFATQQPFVDKKNSISKSNILMSFVYFALVILCIGRYSVNEMRRLSNSLFYLTPAPSCCTPAMLFPRKGAKIVSTFLKSVTCKKGYAKDSAIDELVENRRLVTRLVEPNLFKHIGHFSSLRRDFLNPFII